MIIKPRGIPRKLAALASLVSRLPDSAASMQKVKSDYKMSRAGFAGELKVDKFLEELELQRPHYIIHDLDIKIGTKKVQIDTILFHPNFILLMEIKNMRGEFYFDPKNRQFFRVNDNGKKEGMRNPEAQVNRAIKAINTFLCSKGYDGIAEGIIVLVSRAGIVMNAPERWKTIPLDSLTEFIEALERQTSSVFTDDICKKLALSLLDEDRSEAVSGLTTYYAVSEKDVIRGVRCPECHQIPMERKHTRWSCTRCGAECRNAHLGSLQEYRLLFGPEITSRHAKEFFQNESMNFTIRVLNKSAVPKAGKVRYRLFHISEKLTYLEGFVNKEMKQ
ncbi:nuclease-related domain-containing protein [Sporosarcina psychrophila]|uniref:nuclease-related domain-containing protein n=1 Tax=Sporosarcina psychrophila TaxID=1476 RepID=UPI0030D1E4A2